MLLGIYAFMQNAFEMQLRCNALIYAASSVITSHLMAFVLVRPVLRRMNLAQSNRTRQNSLEMCVEQLRSEVAQLTQSLASDKYCRFADWSLVAGLLDGDLKHITFSIADLVRRGAQARSADQQPDLRPSRAIGRVSMLAALIAPRDTLPEMRARALHEGARPLAAVGASPGAAAWEVIAGAENRQTIFFQVSNTRNTSPEAPRLERKPSQQSVLPSRLV